MQIEGFGCYTPERFTSPIGNRALLMILMFFS